MNGEVIDLIPEATTDEQLVLLPPETFALIDALHKSGAITLTSLSIEQPLAYDQADALLTWFGVLKRSSSWWIGDLLNQLEVTNPEEFAQLSEATGLAESTRLAFQAVCANVAVKIRKTNLGFSHHARVSVRLHEGAEGVARQGVEAGVDVRDARGAHEGPPGRERPSFPAPRARTGRSTGSSCSRWRRRSSGTRPRAPTTRART